MKIVRLLLWIFLIAAIFINFLGALSPELAFDALWYHLTIPKLYNISGSIYHIPGGLLYYSSMPRLVEIIFTVLLPVFSETGPHMLSFFAGIGCLVLIYKISSKYFDRPTALLSMVIFYVTPLVGWLSGSTYIDLIRTFWEILVVYFFLEKKYFWLGITLGLLVGTKTLALGSWFIIAAIFIFQKESWKTIASTLLIATIVAVPWFLSAYLNTGYPFYPIGSGVLDSSHGLTFAPLSFFTDFWNVFIVPIDPISPIFVITLPFVILFVHKSRKPIVKTLFWYMFLSYVAWWIIPKTGGGRFLLPYLPVWSILVGAYTVWLKDIWLHAFLVLTIVYISFIHVGYRALAIRKTVPYLLHHESKETYLCRNLDFSLAVFVDCDSWFSKNIKKTDLVLVSGEHNLFYINFPFVHETWYRGENVSHVLIFDSKFTSLTVRLFRELGGQLIYTNPTTRVSLYKLGRL